MTCSARLAVIRSLQETWLESALGCFQNCAVPNHSWDHCKTALHFFWKLFYVFKVLELLVQLQAAESKGSWLFLQYLPDKKPPEFRSQSCWSTCAGNCKGTDISCQDFISVSEMAQVGNKTLQSKYPLCRSNGIVSATKFSAVWRNLNCFCCSGWDHRSQTSYASWCGVLRWHSSAGTKWFNLQ